MITVNTIAGQQQPNGHRRPWASVNIGAVHVAVLAVVWLVMHSVLAWKFGVRNLFDADLYIKGADFLVHNGRLQDTHHIFYGVPIVLMALFRSLFVGKIIPFLFFQCIISALATWCLYKSANKIFKTTLAGFFASLIFLLWWDNLQWNTIAMTESLMCSAICFLIYRLAHFTGKTTDYYWIAAWLILIFFTRPTGIVIIVGVISFLLWYYRNAIYRSAWKYPVVVVLFVIMYGTAHAMFGRWDFTEQYAKGNIVTYMDGIEGDALYDSTLVVRSENLKFADADRHPMMKMTFFIIHNPVYVVKTGVLKIWYMLSAVRPYYSNLHNTYSLVWLLSIYSLLYVGWRKVWSSATSVFVITVIGVNCGLIALATVDWDNRFYIPMEPGIVLLAGGGAASLFKRLIEKRKQQDSNGEQNRKLTIA